MTAGIKIPRLPKRLAYGCAALAMGALATPAAAEPSPAQVSQFTSRVYFLIHESSPVQIERGRTLIEQQFANTFSGMPQLQPHRYQVVSDGNEVVISMVSDEDLRTPFQSVVSEVVGQVNGRFRTRGRADFLRTSLEEPPGGYLEVVLDESSTKIRSIVARSVPLRDLLAELQLQFSDIRSLNPEAARQVPGFSYMVPGECASRQVEWSFGADGDQAPKSLDEAMKEVARLFNLGVENLHGTYIFTGQCPRPTLARRPNRPFEFLPSRWIPLGDFPSAMRQPPRQRALPLPPAVRTPVVHTLQE